MATEAQTQLLVRFVTKLPPELHVPPTEVAVPASVKRYGLSKIINHLLALDPPRPFDFLIGGELLRKSLEHHALDVGASAEAVLEVEYIPAVVPPKPQPAAATDDWVSALASADAEEGPCTSGACDGAVRLWDAAGRPTPKATSLAHPGGVNAMALVPAGGASLLLTAGKDHRLVLWDLAGGQAPAAVATYKGHHDAVDAVAASPSGRRCASGGWDGALLVWRAGSEVVEAAAQAGSSAATNGSAPAAVDGRAARVSKKQRRGRGVDGGADADGDAPAAAAPAPAHEEVALTRLQAHTGGCVGALSWPEEAALFSGGWDHSVRRHDVPTGINTDTYNGSHVVLAVAAAPAAPRVVAFGGSERCVRVWDARAGGAGDARAFAGHGGWVSALAWRPGSEHVFASACFDGSVRLWDARSAVPLATLPQHQDKALCVGWWGPDRLVSGGADCALCVAALTGGGAQAGEPALGAAAS